MLKSAFRTLALVGAIAFAPVIAMAAQYTNSVTLPKPSGQASDWQDLGAGPVQIVAAQTGLVFVIVSDSQPAAGVVGDPIPGNDPRPFSYNTPYHVWARAANSATVIDVTPLISPAASSGTTPGNSSYTTVVSPSYQLLSNASATGAQITNALGGQYSVVLNGTFNGASVTLTSTLGGQTSTLGTYTSSPSGVNVLINQGAALQATVTGGPPSGLNMTLSSCGPPGCGSVVVVPTGSTGTDFSANAGAFPNIGGTVGTTTFGGTGPYASYVLIKVIAAMPRNYVDIENVSGAQIAVMRDDGTATSGNAPVNASVFSLGGSSTSTNGAQGGSWTSTTFKGRLQIYAPQSSAFVTVMQD